MQSAEGERGQKRWEDAQGEEEEEEEASSP